MGVRKPQIKEAGGHQKLEEAKKFLSWSLTGTAVFLTP